MNSRIENIPKILRGMKLPHGFNSEALTKAASMIERAEAELAKVKAERDHFADAGKMVEEENAKLRKQVSNPQFSGIQCLADIREAVGDPTGKLMQDELVALVRKIVAERDALARRIADAPGAQSRQLEQSNSSVLGSIGRTNLRVHGRKI